MRWCGGSRTTPQTDGGRADVKQPSKRADIAFAPFDGSKLDRSDFPVVVEERALVIEMRWLEVKKGPLVGGRRETWMLRSDRKASTSETSTQSKFKLRVQKFKAAKLRLSKLSLLLLVETKGSQRVAGLLLGPLLCVRGLFHYTLEHCLTNGSQHELSRHDEGKAGDTPSFLTHGVRQRHHKLNPHPRIALSGTTSWRRHFSF